MGAWGFVPAMAASSNVVWRRQDLLSTWFPYLVHGFAFFGGFYVRQPSLSRVSARFFESLIDGGTLWLGSTDMDMNTGIRHGDTKNSKKLGHGYGKDTT